MTGARRTLRAQANTDRDLSPSDRVNLLKAALESFDRSIALDPHSLAGYSNRAMAKAQAGDFSGAVSDFSQAIELNPDDARLYLNRGFVRRGWGEIRLREIEHDSGRNKDGTIELDGVAKSRFKDAIDDFNKAIKLDRNIPLVFEHRGEAKRLLGDLDGAIEDYNLQIQVKPDSATAYNNRATAYKDKGDTTKALQDYTRAIELNRQDATAYFNRGLLRLEIALSSKSSELEAQQDFDIGLRLNPSMRPQVEAIIRAIQDRNRSQARNAASR